LEYFATLFSANANTAVHVLHAAARANKGLRNKTRATAGEVASAQGFQDIARLLGG
jgi:hypothetical protein